MYRNVNLDAHLAALLFLGSAGLLVILTVTTLIFGAWRKQWLRYTVTALLVLAVGYGLLLAGFSLFSHDRTLARGEEKYFCELDCHLAYSVQDVQRTESIGDVHADGEFYVVTIRTRFDETTTASWRPRDVPVNPDPLNFAIVAGNGQSIGISEAGQKAWNAGHGESHSMLESLVPGDSYQTTLVFDVPMDVASPRLLASFSVFPTQVLIGDESSLLHKKTYFGL